MNSSKPVAPIWKTKYVNQVQSLYTGKARLTVNARSFDLEAHAELHWLPSPRVTIWANGPFDLFQYWQQSGMTIELVEQWPGIQIGVFATRCILRDEGTQLDFVVSRWPDELLTSVASSAVFHIANLRTYNGGSLKNDSRLWRERGSLVCPDWTIVLDEICPDDVPDALGHSGGFALTHVGYFERTDGTSFSGIDTGDLMSAVGQFLSFCNGRRCGPILCHGLDSTQSPNAWTDWRIKRTWPIQTVRSWWNEDVGIEPFSCFARFYELSHDEIWSETLRVAVHWYLEANRAGALTEAGIVLAQLAFEGLADTLIVEDKGLLSSEGLQKLETHDKLRLLLRTCGIPTEVTPSQPRLSKIAKSLGWDAPDAITEVRNCHVHPTKKNRERLIKMGVTPDVKLDVSLLSLYYLELMILFVLDSAGLVLRLVRPSSRPPFSKDSEKLLKVLSEFW